MPTVFSANELLDIATGIERRGITFYDVMAKSTDNEETRAVFEDLVEMEREHLRIFEDMLVEISQFEPPEPAPEETHEYIRALIDEAVFTDDLITSEMAGQADSDIKALELAIGAEKDSVLFYYELKEMIPLRLAPLVNRIIGEEKKHLSQLTAIKKNLSES